MTDHDTPDTTADDDEPIPDVTGVGQVIAAAFGGDAADHATAFVGGKGPTAQSRAERLAAEAGVDVSMYRDDEGRDYAHILRAAPPAPDRDAAWNAAIPRRFADAHPDRLDTDQKRALARALRDDPTLSLLLTGPVGCGKTYTAVACARDVHDRGGHIEFFDVGSMMRQVVPYGPDPIVDRAVAADLLILDALGDEPLTDYKVGRLYDVVNRRWLDELPTIATTNLGVDPADERSLINDDDPTPPLARAIGPRTLSRLLADAIVGRFSSDEHDRRTT